MNIQLRSSANQSGMTLIEVLIALAVLSIGLAGMAAMHMQTLQFVHSAYYRSLASTVALDFEERLWLELATLSSGCPDVTTGSGSVAAEVISDWNRANVGSGWTWSTAAQVRIPSLTINTGTPIAGVNVWTIPTTFSWNESRFGDSESTTESFTYDVRIMCRPIVAT